MKIIVTHQSADFDALLSAYIIKTFKKGWSDAEVRYVPAGETIDGVARGGEDVIVPLSNDVEVIHVDTGLGPLDHHATSDMCVCAASLAFDYVLQDPECSIHNHDIKREAVSRLVSFAVDIDHFQELFYPDANSDMYEFTLVGLIDGYKLANGFSDEALSEYMFEAFDAYIHTLENKIFAEREIDEHGEEFESRWGRGLAIETVNDETMKIAMKKGFVVVVRRDPNRGFLRIKALPNRRDRCESLNEVFVREQKKDTSYIDLSEIYEDIVKKDPDATWFLHASGKMLLNGSAKNPQSRASRLSLSDIITLLR